MRPPVPYYGSKVTIAPAIVRLLPVHRHYVEPFAGSLSVLLAKPPSAMETVSDIDGRLMAFWRVLRDRPDELARVCALTPHGRAEYAAAREATGDELEDARRLWVLLTQSRTGAVGKRGWRYAVGPDNGWSVPQYLAAYAGRIPAAARRLRAVSLESRPALEIIARYGAHPDVLLYADPPYLGSTRERNYAHELAGEDDHRDLAAALRAARAAVVLSGYPSPLYDALYGDWHRHEIPAATTQGGARGERTEVLWSNRPLGRRSAQPGLFDEETEEVPA